MPEPDGQLTPGQYETLEVIWGFGASGATVAEIWNAIKKQRNITRTTVINQVDRLERRGWLSRTKTDDGFRYQACQSQVQVTNNLLGEFIDAFFGGSATNLAMSLLGSKKLKPADIARLRQILEKRSSTKSNQA